MHEYSRNVYYYETDKMGVVHHSNYLRWMEEARTSYFDHVGMPYEVTESLGVLCPITSVDLKYKLFARFGESFTVKLKMTKYTGVRFEVKYLIVNGDGGILVEACSQHAFVSEQYRPVSLSRALPELHKKMLLYIEPDDCGA